MGNIRLYDCVDEFGSNRDDEDLEVTDAGGVNAFCWSERRGCFYTASRRSIKVFVKSGAWAVLHDDLIRVSVFAPPCVTAGIQKLSSRAWASSSRALATLEGRRECERCVGEGHQSRDGESERVELRHPC